MANRSTNISDPELTALIKTFSEDIGPDGQAAWQKLQSYQRQDLIKSILALRDGLRKDDPRRYSIAFVLCNLDYEYQANVEQVVSALTPDGANYYADSAATMLGRLVHRGDKGLLKVLFDAVSSSDASLGEALSDVFTDELRSNPNEFLTQLKDEPKPIRLKVYKLIGIRFVNRERYREPKSQFALTLTIDANLKSRKGDARLFDIQELVLEFCLQLRRRESIDQSRRAQRRDQQLRL